MKIGIRLKTLTMGKHQVSSLATRLVTSLATRVKHQQRIPMFPIKIIRTAINFLMVNISCISCRKLFRHLSGIHFISSGVGTWPHDIFNRYFQLYCSSVKISV